MNQEEFQKFYEDESDRIFTELNKLTEDDLLNIISDKKGASLKFGADVTIILYGEFFKLKGQRSPLSHYLKL